MGLQRVIISIEESKKTVQGVLGWNGQVEGLTEKGKWGMSHEHFWRENVLEGRASAEWEGEGGRVSLEAPGRKDEKFFDFHSKGG